MLVRCSLCTRYKVNVSIEHFKRYNVAIAPWSEDAPMNNTYVCTLLIKVLVVLHSLRT